MVAAEVGAKVAAKVAADVAAGAVADVAVVNGHVGEVRAAVHVILRSGYGACI